MNRTERLLIEQKKIKLPDAIIATTAIVRHLILVTRNTPDFRVAGISMINPFEQTS